jgi:hypothetical protein
MPCDLSTSRPGRLAATTIGILAALSAFFGVAPVAHATLRLTAQSVTANAGAVNDAFDVYLTNLGTALVDVAAFSFEITTSSSDVTFEESTTATSLFPYILAGNSLFGPVISTNAPGQTLDASDVAAVVGSFTVVNPGSSFGLGKVFFDVAPSASAEVASVDFNANIAFTSVLDQSGNLFSLNFSNGQITINAAAAVPEPSSAVLLLTALAAIGVRRAASHGAWLRRFNY